MIAGRAEEAARRTEINKIYKIINDNKNKETKRGGSITREEIN